MFSHLDVRTNAAVNTLISVQHVYLSQNVGYELSVLDIMFKWINLIVISDNVNVFLLVIPCVLKKLVLNLLLYVRTDATVKKMIGIQGSSRMKPFNNDNSDRDSVQYILSQRL